MSKNLNSIGTNDAVAVLNRKGVLDHTEAVMLARPLFLELRNGARYSREDGSPLNATAEGTCIRLAAQDEVEVGYAEARKRKEKADFVLTLLTMQSALVSTIQGIVTNGIDESIGSPGEVPRGFEVLIGIIEAHQEKLGLLKRDKRTPDAKDVQETILKSVVRDLRDSARSLCEQAQFSNNVTFERLFNCVRSIENSETILPAIGLSTTMLSTAQLTEREGWAKEPARRRRTHERS